MFFCTICLNSNDFAKKGSDWDPTCTPCGHVYHKYCLMRWIYARRANMLEEDENDFDDDEDAKCPMCSSHFMTDDLRRIFLEEPNKKDEGIQTEPLRDFILKLNEKKGNLVLEPDVVAFVKQTLTEKWEAEKKVRILKTQKQKLETVVATLIQQNLIKAVQLEVAEKIINDNSAPKVSLILMNSGLWQMNAKKITPKKRWGLWRKVYKTFFHPAGH